MGEKKTTSKEFFSSWSQVKKKNERKKAEWLPTVEISQTRSF